MSIDVILEDDRWAPFRGVMERAGEATLTHLALDSKKMDVTILGCSDARIAELNSDFRKKTEPTNVLSWPSEERGADTEGAKPHPPSGESELGDIAISYDTCLKEADSGAVSLENHAMHLVVHGVLHLLGYDHINDADGDLMEATEIAILVKLGVENPYIE